MKSERFAAGLLVGLVVGGLAGLLGGGVQWARVVGGYRAEAARSLDLAERSREQLLACHQADPLSWALRRGGDGTD